MRKNWEYETCSCCTREQRVAWYIQDRIWERVVISYYINKVLCLECFLRMADDKKIKVELADIIIEGIISRGV